MNFAQTERAALCDLLQSVGPDAPTLCEGWNSADLAAHLWIRETDVLGAPGIVVKPLAPLTDRRMAEVLTKYTYEELVERLAAGPIPWSVFALPGVDAAANALEYFVHHEDVRRCTDDAAPRDLGEETEELMWRRLKLMGRAFFRRAGVGVVLARSDRDDDEFHAMPGKQTVRIVGKPSELMFLAYGRGAAADVDLLGEPDALERFSNADLDL